MTKSSIILIVLWALAAQAETPLPDATKEARAQALFHELRCVVCQGENIADSSADIAADMRSQVRKMVAEGDDNDDIQSFFVSRYGEGVLMTPRLTPATWLLWAGPLVILALGLAIVLAYFGMGRVTKR